MAKDILKEAIADAKAVREVALANAKAALEEAFTPKLQSMLSAKLEEDLDEDMYYDEDESMDEGMHDEDDMDEGGAAKVKFDLMKGTVIIMHMELRYKGGFTSQPQFFGIMSKDFKDVLKGKCV